MRNRRMKVLIFTLGTRGDVQPFIALAQGLQQKGHNVVVAAPHRFGDFIKSHGVTFAGVDEGPMRIMDGSDAGAIIEGGLKARLKQAKTMPAMFKQTLEDCWDIASKGAGRNADIIIHNGQILAGQHIAEVLHVPAVLALPLPMYVPTKEFAWAGSAMPTHLPGFLNKLTYLGMKGPEIMFGKVVEQWRQETLHLPKRKDSLNPMVTPDGHHATVLHAFSPSVIPPAKDWPKEVITTGYWNLQENPTPLPEETTAFIAAGDAPIFVGFGSMLGKNPERITQVVVEAAKRTGKRLVIGAGWGGLSVDDSSQDTVHVVRDVDYSSLFPQMAAIVHHGGAGTTGTAFASGRPQIICPFVGDQPFWAHRAYLLGVAPKPLPQQKLTADALAKAIMQTADSGMQDNARQLKNKLEGEHGVEKAVLTLEKL